jgi:plastocyanin
MSRQAMAFLPNEIWIKQNDSITWTSQTDEIHTVSLLKQSSGGAPLAGTIRPPFPAGCTAGGQGGPVGTPNPSSFDGTACVNSNILAAPQSYTVTFPQTGNYKFVCLIHRDMTGAVHVLPLDSALPYTQKDYDRMAANQSQALLKDKDNGKEDGEDFKTGVNQVITTGELVATGGGKSYLAIMRFLPTKIVVHVGETVEWTNQDPTEPHTITFSPPGVRGTALEPGAGAPVGVNGALDGAESGILPNSAGTAAACGAGKSCLNTGLLGAALQDQVSQTPLGLTTARITFTTPGTYDYYCVLHDDLGMVGTVVVLK